MNSFEEIVTKFYVIVEALLIKWFPRKYTGCFKLGQGLYKLDINQIADKWMNAISSKKQSNAPNFINVSLPASS